MQMFKFITKARRDRWRDQVIDNGKKLRAAEAARATVDARHWPEDADYLDGVIDYHTRKRDRLLTKLKETA
jgi:hypothetical protein